MSDGKCLFCGGDTSFLTTIPGKVCLSCGDKLQVQGVFLSTAPPVRLRGEAVQALCGMRSILEDLSHLNEAWGDKIGKFIERYSVDRSEVLEEERDCYRRSMNSLAQKVERVRHYCFGRRGSPIPEVALALADIIEIVREEKPS